MILRLICWEERGRDAWPKQDGRGWERGSEIFREAALPPGDAMKELSGRIVRLSEFFLREL